MFLHALFHEALTELDQLLCTVLHPRSESQHDTLIT